MNKVLRSKVRLDAGDALIVVDVQNDFLPGERLGIPSDDDVIAPLNEYLAKFAKSHLPVFATRDGHPTNYCSCQTPGDRWPVRSVVDKRRTQLASSLAFPPWTVVIFSGVAADKEAHSGFQGTDLQRRLHGHSIQRLFIAGLTDHSVINTVRDALAGRFKVYLLEDAIWIVGIEAADGQKAKAQMARLGAVPLRRKDLTP